ncbi:hypothetical protein Avbf_12906 [Armadillidium vulgare]|nr:hypothetical protein Avbf_12906 [Armadillidium vulgare]
MGYFAGQRNPITEEELKRKMKGKKEKFLKEEKNSCSYSRKGLIEPALLSQQRVGREIVGESNKDLLKKLFEKLLEEEIIQRLNSLRRQQKAYCLNHYLRLYIHPIIPSLTNITNTLLMEGRKIYGDSLKIRFSRGDNQLKAAKSEEEQYFERECIVFMLI